MFNVARILAHYLLAFSDYSEHRWKRKWAARQGCPVEASGGGGSNMPAEEQQQDHDRSVALALLMHLTNTVW